MARRLCPSRHQDGLPARHRTGDPRTPCAAALALALLPALGTVAPAAAQPARIAERPVVAVEILERNGGRPEFSAQGDWIAFDRTGSDGRYDIHLLRVDTGAVRCLTCEVYDLRKANNLSPTWHPSGRYVIFQAQSLAKRLGLDATDLVTPDRGAHAELFIIRVDGKAYWQLSRSTGAVLDPRVSHEGDKLAWSERIGKGGDGHWGAWTLRLARIDVDGKIPHLGRVQSFRPGDQPALIVPHGFAPDDRRVLLSGNLEEGQRESGSDLYLFDPDSKQLQRLTHTRNNWDVHASFAPDGETIAWTSTAEIVGAPAHGSGLPPHLRRDLWLMRSDGSDKSRLTYFNGSGAPEGLGQAYVGDFSWSPDGESIVAHVISGSEKREDLYRVKLSATFHR